MGRAGSESRPGPQGAGLPHQKNVSHAARGGWGERGQPKGVLPAAPSAPPPPVGPSSHVSAGTQVPEGQARRPARTSPRVLCSTCPPSCSRRVRPACDAGLAFGRAWG